MITTIRRTLAATLILAGVSASAAAQQRAGLMGDLMKDVGDLQGKMIGLAKAIPVTKYDWRPGTGVRSVGEVFLHVAADNYVMPWGLGVQADPTTGLKTNDFKSVGVFEKQQLDQSAMLAAMEKSFVHLLKAMADTPDAKLDDHIKLFGMDMTIRQMWIMTTTHLHEHLGQAIAYARSNNVVPPWSK